MLSWADYIRRLAGKAEEAGILVFRSGTVGNNTRPKVDVQEVRGVALSDPLAPAIFVNSSDAKAAQVFTIAHEPAHLWLGETGVSDLTPDTETSQVTSEIELTCNKVAAEFLVPESEFLEQLASERDRQTQPKREQLGGSFRRNLVARNSRLLVDAVFESVLAGRSVVQISS